METNNNNNPNKYGNYNVDDFCIETYPCRHKVVNNITGETKVMSGDAIYRLFTEKNIQVPRHFMGYARFVE